MTDYSKYEIFDPTNTYGKYLHTAAKACGFYDFENADACQSICHCADSDKNRSLIITAICSEQHHILNDLEEIPSADFDLGLYRIRKFDKHYQLLFLDGNPPEMDPICLAIWDESEQVWLLRL